MGGTGARTLGMRLATSPVVRMELMTSRKDSSLISAWGGEG